MRQHGPYQKVQTALDGGETHTSPLVGTTWRSSQRKDKRYYANRSDCSTLGKRGGFMRRPARDSNRTTERGFGGRKKKKTLREEKRRRAPERRRLPRGLNNVHNFRGQRDKIITRAPSGSIEKRLSEARAQKLGDRGGRRARPLESKRMNRSRGRRASSTVQGRNAS